MIGLAWISLVISLAFCGIGLTALLGAVGKPGATDEVPVGLLLVVSMLPQIVLALVVLTGGAQ